MSIIKILIIFILFLLNIAAIGIIFFMVQPVANWYFSKQPALGVDLYYSATYVEFFLKNPGSIISGFKDIWFAGYPLFNDIFQLQFYPMAVFAKYMGLIEGIQTYIMVSFFLLVVFSYLLFYQLSRNIFLSLVLSLGIVYSANMYGAAIWGGSLPYFTTQMFFPLIFLFLVKFKQTKNKRWFFAGALTTGIAMLGHPFPIYANIVPVAFFLLFFWITPGAKYSIVQRFKNFFLFGVLIVLVGLRLFYDIIVNTFKGFLGGDIFGVFKAATGSSSAEVSNQAVTSPEIIAYYKSLGKVLFTDTAQILFVLLGAGIVVFIVSLLFKNRLSKLGMILPFVLIVSYFISQVYAASLGHQFLFAGWYRAYWPFPIALGALAAVLWGQLFSSLNFSIPTSKKMFFFSTLKFIIVLAISVGLALAGYVFFQNEKDRIFTKLDSKSEYSSAFPEIISIKIDKKSREELKKTLLPSFMDPNDKNKRLYESDASVNIWWNSFFDIPLARGYIDPPIGTDRRGGIFWMDIAIANDSLVRDFKAPEDIAFANSLFLIDWNAINFFEGGRESSKGPSTPPSSYLLKNNIFEKDELVENKGAILKYQTASGKPELIWDLPQYLHYFKVKDEHTSNILSATNAPAVLVFSQFADYEDFLRIIASQNINSKKLIPINAGPFIDDFSLEQLKQFDAVFLQNYSYHNKNKAFDLLEKYVIEGGKVFIDTDSEVKEANSNSLPDIFPINSLERLEMGTEWVMNSVSSASGILKDVNTSKFGPLIFNGNEWKITTTEDRKLRKGSKVILRHKGKPVLIERDLGKGKVVWSGFNLFYHYNQYKVDDEARLLINILNQFTSIQTNPPVVSEAKWIKPEKVIISTNAKPRGILFKEQGYEGWQARVTSDGNEQLQGNKKLPIYLAGPSYPGFMYVSTKDLSNKPLTLEFNYTDKGSFWRISLISLITILELLDQIIFKGVVTRLLLGPVLRLAKSKMKGWWEKEDEV